ncbi:hypothetical protein K0M31_017190, partial [Melipona bicolor]
SLRRKGFLVLSIFDHLAAIVVSFACHLSKHLNNFEYSVSAYLTRELRLQPPNVSLRVSSIRSLSPCSLPKERTVQAQHPFSSDNPYRNGRLEINTPGVSPQLRRARNTEISGASRFVGSQPDIDIHLFP